MDWQLRQELEHDIERWHLVGEQLPRQRMRALHADYPEDRSLDDNQLMLCEMILEIRVVSSGFDVLHPDPVVVARKERLAAWCRRYWYQRQDVTLPRENLSPEEIEMRATMVDPNLMSGIEFREWLDELIRRHQEG